MNAISRLRLSRKLMLLIAVPLLIILLFALYQSWRALDLRLKSGQLEVMVEFSVHASQLVHEIQKERGMTAGFIGSNGSKFGAQLKLQRDQVNAKLSSLMQFIDDSLLGLLISLVLSTLIGRNTRYQIGGEPAEIERIAREVAVGNDNLSSRTEQQATALEQTSASTDELTCTVTNNAENTTLAN